LADIDSTRIGLGEQVLADFAQAEAGQARLAALQASLASSDNIARAWGRQFVAGRKTWLDVMNAVREQAQLETQIADARASQLLLTWRLNIVGRGLENTLVLGHNSTAADKSPATLETATHEQSLADAFSDESWQSTGQVPLYAQNTSDALDLRMAGEIDTLHLGLGLGLMTEAKKGPESDPTNGPPAAHNNFSKEGTW
jgi:inorganic triphosphatase YgiF